MATGAELRLPPPQVCAHAADQFDGFYEGGATRLDWQANRRAIDRVKPGYDAGGAPPLGARGTRNRQAPAQANLFAPIWVF